MSTDGYLSPQWRRSVLLTIDMQHDFVLPGAAAEIPGCADTAPEIIKLAHAYRQRSLPIIHTVRLCKPGRVGSGLCRPRGSEDGPQRGVPGTVGALLLEGLNGGADQDDEALLEHGFQSVGPSEWIVDKPGWGAFYKTSLETMLDSLEVTTVVVCGCGFPDSPRASIYQASERDYRIAAVRDGLSGIYERGISELANIGVHLCTADEVMEALDVVEL